MRREVSPVQTVWIVIAALAVVLGLGYYFVIGRDSASEMTMPAAQSRADMTRQFHAVKLGGNAPGQKRGAP